MNNKEEVLILAEMQLKSLGFIDLTAISQRLNIDSEYVYQVIRRSVKERIMNIWTDLEKLDISSDRIIKLALLKTMLNTKLNQEKDMKKLLLETFELNDLGRVDDDFLHQVIHESLKMISDIEKIKNNINQLESIAIYKNNLFIKKIKNTKRRVIV